MPATFFDRQDEQSLLNGSVLETDTDLQAILRKPADREPFFCELEGPNGRRLLVGLSDDAGCVEYRSDAGEPVRLRAVANGAGESEGHTEFLLGGEPTSVPNRYRLPMEALLETAGVFLRTGGLNSEVSWEAIRD